MTSPPSSPAYQALNTTDFEARVRDVKIDKSRMNTLVMDYLIGEGYPLAAQKFSQEANIQPQMDMESIGERVEIRNAIYRGDVQTAIVKINELNPQILDLYPELHFSLLRLHLIELIRTSPQDDIIPALNFATAHLAPRAPSNPKFLADLELTMSLLIFPPEKLAPQLAALLDPGLRKEVAKDVNDALLRGEGDKSRCRLSELVKTRAWAEKKCRDEGKRVPSKIEIGLEEGVDGGPGNDNGTGKSLIFSELQ